MENKNLSFPYSVAYPFCFRTHRCIVNVSRGCVREIDFNIVRHFFKEVGRNQPLLTIKFTLQHDGKFGEYLTKANVGFQEGKEILLPIAKAVRKRRCPAKVTGGLKSLHT